MKISKRMISALNNQIAMEAFASNYYLSMATWCEVTGYEGSAKFFFVQSDEERTHMLKIIHYLSDCGAAAAVPSVKAPPKAPNSLETILKTALKNEQAVSKAIHKMVELAQKEKDHSTFGFLQWFVTEQVEEETKFETILQKFNLIGRDKLAINEIDKILGTMASQPSAEESTT